MFGRTIAKILFILVLSESIGFAVEIETGITHKIFNAQFAKKIRVGMKIDGLNKLIGVSGMPVAKDRLHWDGGRFSYLNVITYNGVIKRAVITTPNGQDIIIEGAN